MEAIMWKIKYVFTEDDIEFFKKDDKFHWDDVVRMFGAEPAVVACNQKNLIIDCDGNNGSSGYIWWKTKDTPAKRVKDKDDSGLDISYIIDLNSSGTKGLTSKGAEGSKEICIQALKWMIERGITK